MMHSKKNNLNIEVECGEVQGRVKTVVAQLVPWNFARKGVKELLTDELCGFFVCSRRIATLGGLPTL